MIRRSLAFFLILCLPCFALAGPASAAAKAGSSCAKAGKERLVSKKVYVCTKSGKKLVWVLQKSKKSSVVIPVIPAQPQEVFVPFSKSKYPELFIPQIVYRNLNLFIPKLPFLKTNMQFVTEPFSQPNRSAILQKGIDEGIIFFNSLDFQIKSPVIIVFAYSNDWAKETLIKYGCQWEGLRSKDYKPLSWTGLKMVDKCVGEDGILREAILQNTNTDGQQSIESMHTLTHELFHVWQSENVSPDFGINSQNYFPRWFYESVPQALTVMAYSNWHPYLSYDQWLDYWFDNFRIGERSSCVNAKIQDLVAPGSDLSTLCVYSKGVLAVDILIAKYGGIENLKKLYTSHTPGKDFGLTFKEVTGQDINIFYDDVNRYFVERKWSNPS